MSLSTKIKGNCVGLFVLERASTSDSHNNFSFTNLIFSTFLTDFPLVRVCTIPEPFVVIEPVIFSGSIHNTEFTFDFGRETH